MPSSSSERSTSHRWTKAWDLSSLCGHTPLSLLKVARFFVFYCVFVGAQSCHLVLLCPKASKCNSEPSQVTRSLPWWESRTQRTMNQAPRNARHSLSTAVRGVDWVQDLLAGPPYVTKHTPPLVPCSPDSRWKKATPTVLMPLTDENMGRPTKKAPTTPEMQTMSPAGRRPPGAAATAPARLGEGARPSFPQFVLQGSTRRVKRC